MAETREFDIVVSVKGNKEADRNLQKTESNFSKLQASIVTTNQALDLAGRGFNVLSGAVSQTFAALDQASVLEGVTKGFENLQTQAGLLADDSLAKLQVATRGMVSEFDLMLAANNAAQLGLDPAKFDELSAAAVKLGASVGRNAVESINDLTIGVGRASPKILDNLGVIVKAEQAYESYAAKLGTTVEGLSELQKAEAFRATALDAILKKSASLDEIQLNAGQSAKVLQATIADLTAEFLSALNENEALAESLQDLAGNLATVDFSNLAEGLANIITFALDAANAMTDLARAAGLFIDKVDPLADFRKEVAALAKQAEPTKALTERTNELIAAHVKLQKETDTLAKSRTALLNSGLPLVKEAQIMDQQVRSNAAVLVTLQQKIALLMQVTDRQTEAQKKANAATKAGVADTKDLDKAIAKLNGEIDQLGTKNAVEELKKQLEAAAKAGDLINFDRLKVELAAAITEGKIKGQADAKIAEDARFQELAKQYGEIQTGPIAQAALEKGKEMQQDAFQESADFFSDAIFNALNGGFRDFEEIGKRMLADMAGGFLAEISGNANPGGLSGGRGAGQQLAQQVGGFDFGSIFGGGGGSGGGIPGLQGGAPLDGNGQIQGTSAGGIGNAAAYLPVVISVVSDVSTAARSGASNREIGRGAGSAVGAAAGAYIGGPVGAAIGSEIVGAYYGELMSHFHSGRNADAVRRDDALDSIFGEGAIPFQTATRGEINIRDTEHDVEQGGLAEQAIALTTGLGSIFGGGDDKIKDDLTGIFANAVAEAENFNEVLINTQGLFGEMGISIDDAKNSLTSLFLDGEVGLEEFGAGVHSFNILATDDLVGPDSVNDALNILAQNLGEEGKPRVALRAIELAFSEMAERGVDSSEEIRAFLVDTFGPEVADTFARVSESGINSFTDFASLSADQIFELFNTVANIGDDIEGALGKSFVGAANTSTAALNDIINKLHEVQRASGQTATEAGTIGFGNGTIPPLFSTDKRTGSKRTDLNPTPGINA